MGFIFSLLCCLLCLMGSVAGWFGLVSIFFLHFMKSKLPTSQHLKVENTFRHRRCVSVCAWFHFAGLLSVFCGVPPVPALLVSARNAFSRCFCLCLCFFSLSTCCLYPRSAGKYNVSNSEYTRFSNVLQRFENDKIVGTIKARDSIQVNIECIWLFV